MFLLYGSDINELRRHIHAIYVRKGYKSSCKFWLEPDILLDKNKRGDFTEKQLKEIEDINQKNEPLLMDLLNKFYNQDKIEAVRI
ncbi:MAG: DUF4160 domain-containing protein [Cytophagales bacterium]